MPLSNSILLAALVLLTSCASLTGNAAPPMPMRPGVVEFNLRQLDPQGNRPSSGFQPLTYEFCVPANPNATGGVESIDRTVRCHPGVPGRIGCLPNQALCVGNTGQSNWASVLAELSNEPFVRRIIDTGMPTPPQN